MPAMQTRLGRLASLVRGATKSCGGHARGMSARTGVVELFVVVHVGRRDVTDAILKLKNPAWRNMCRLDLNVHLTGVVQTTHGCRLVLRLHCEQ